MNQNNNFIEVQTEQTADQPVRAARRRNPAWIAAAAVMILAAIAAALFLPQMIRYGRAEQMLAQGEYEQAREAFEALGDYRDAAAQVENAEKSLIYRDAQTLLTQGEYRQALTLYETIEDFGDTREKILEANYLLAAELIEQGERKEARSILESLGNFRDSETLLQQLICQMAYDQASAYMINQNYMEAAEQFRALENFLDAAQKAEECQRLGELKETYEEGKQQYEQGKWLDAYRTLSPIGDAQYEDTISILDEITTVTPERARHYAQLGKRGKLLAFLQLAEEIDAETGSALRQELAAAENFEMDLSSFQFNPRCLTACSPNTRAEEFVATLLYMILNEKTTLSLASEYKLDKATTLQQFFLSQNILGEIIPGSGAVYDYDITVQEYGIELTVSYDETFSEERTQQLVETYEAFCEKSVRDLAESGLLSASMSRKARAEIINEWVGFYLSYDGLLEIQSAGIAVETAKGVCTTYATLYHRMCNLAGIPTYGHRGVAGERHIWVFHVDENGDIFYADPTWADSWDIDFSVEDEKPTVSDFVEKYLERCMEGAVREYRYSNYNDDAGQSGRQYLWARSLWIDHEADRIAEDVIATHKKLLG